MGFGNTIKVVANALVAKFSPDQKRVPAGQHGGGEFAAGDGITAYHGTPNLVPEFSSSHIGEGQGAASYGHGLYFAEELKVAEGYKNQLSPRTQKLQFGFNGRPYDASNDADIAAHSIFVANGDRAGAIKQLRTDQVDLPKASDRIELAIQHILNGTETAGGQPMDVPDEVLGNLYAVKLDVKPSELLDWDRPLYAQGEAVKEKLKAAGVDVTPTDYPSLAAAKRRFQTKQAIRDAESDIGIRESYREGWSFVQAGDVDGWKKWYDNHGGGLFNEKQRSPTGENFYQSLASKKGDEESHKQNRAGGYSEKAASEYLASIGIPGLKYLDQYSRGDFKPTLATNGLWSVGLPQEDVKYFKDKEEAQKFADTLPRTRNIVMFDDSRIHITHVNGKDVRNQPAEIAKAMADICKFNEHHDPKDGKFTTGGDGGGIVAYHGTAHVVPEFSTQFVGTGQSAASFGFGLYFAQEPKVAEDYRKSLAPDNKMQSLSDRMDRLEVNGKPLLKQFPIEADQEFIDLIKKGGHAAAYEYAFNKRNRWEELRDDKDYPHRDYAKEKAEAWDGVSRAVQLGEVTYPALGNTYQVRLDVKPDELLDWDKPLSQQPSIIQKIESLPPHPLGTPREFDYKKTGEYFYEHLSLDAKRASKLLLDIGIPGLRYLDQGSRFTMVKGTHNWEVTNGMNQLVAKEPTEEKARAAMERLQTHNFVIWDDSRIHITHVNGKDVTGKPEEIKKAMDEICKYRDDQPRASDGKWTSGGGGIVAYHGTPHLVPEFSSSHIGSGEGNQSYSYGLYFAENPAVSQSYRNAGRSDLKRFTVSDKARELFDKYYPSGYAVFGKLHGVSVESLATFVHGNRGGLGGEVRDQTPKDLLDELDKGEEKGNLYQVRIDAKPDEMLDWDKRLDEQPPKAREALYGLLEETGGKDILARRFGWGDETDPTSGKVGDAKAPAIYWAISAAMGHNDFVKSGGAVRDEPDDKAASAALMKRGVVGVRYFDEKSRNLAPVDEENVARFRRQLAGAQTSEEKKFAQDGLDRAIVESSKLTRNIVMFDDSRIHITHVNGKELTPAESVQKSIEIRKAFDESQHPRKADGEFTDKGGGQSGVDAAEKHLSDAEEAFRATAKIHGATSPEGDAAYEMYHAAKWAVKMAKLKRDEPTADPMTLDEQHEMLRPLQDLNGGYDEYNGSVSKWVPGEKIGDTKELGPMFKADGSGVLFRSVSLADWGRIKKQGYIDTDMRGAISLEEGMNLTPQVVTAAYYINTGEKGVVLAIDTKGLNLFMVPEADSYIRTRDKVPLDKIVAVSDIIGKHPDAGLYVIRDQSIAKSLGLVGKVFDESEHPRDEKGWFVSKLSEGAQLAWQQKQPTDKYVYYSPLRPVSSISAYLPKGYRPINRDSFAVDEPLPKDKIANWDLEHADAHHPVNMKRDFEAFREKLMWEMNPDDGATVTLRDGHQLIVTPNALDQKNRETYPYRITRVGEDGVPRGHDIYKDFDEIAMALWGSHKDIMSVSSGVGKALGVRVNATHSRGGTAQPEPVLPKSLAGAKPRYGNGSRLFELEFSRPVELALYIIGSKHKSKHEKAYQKWLMSAIPDVTEKDLKVMAQRLREYIRREVKSAKTDVITVPADWEKSISGDSDAAVVKSYAAEFEAIGRVISAPVRKARNALSVMDAEQPVRFFMAVPQSQVAELMKTRQLSGKNIVLTATPAAARKVMQSRCGSAR